jgi:methylated-DNA-[protein]-cysteine S-methyltransferase
VGEMEKRGSREKRAAAVITSPVGSIAVTVEGGRVCAIEFLKRRRRRTAGEGGAVLSRACRQLEQYFAGKRKVFDFPFDTSFGTPFQQAVWRACAKIPWGQTRSYGELAGAAGHPNAARAVGAAMGANRLLLVVPCHRVIASDGSLGGFGAGLPVKAALLRLEGLRLEELRLEGAR